MSKIRTSFLNIYFFLAFSLFALVAEATSPVEFNFHAVIRTPDTGSGRALYNSGAATNVNVQILSPANCILFEENFTQTITDGKLSLAVGTGSQASVTAVRKALTTVQSFDNTAAKTNLDCYNFSSTVNETVTSAQTYTPSSGQGRFLRVKVTNGGAGGDIVAKFNIRSAPFSIRAKSAETADAISGTVAVANGGTGATTAANARTNLGLSPIAASGSASDLTSGTVPTARLGSGTADATTYLRGDGTWATVSAGSSLPAQTGNAGKFLKTDGTNASWNSLAAGDIPSLDGAKITTGNIVRDVVNTNTSSSNGSFNNLKIYDGTNYLTMTKASGSAYSLQWPGADGSSGQVLSTNGAGILSWITPSASGVTGVTAGTGLTGGTITTTGTIGLGTELTGVNGLSTTGYVQRTGAGTYSTTTGNTAASNSTLVLRDGSGVSNFYGVGINGATSGAVTLQAPSVVTNHSLTLPAAQGSANTYLKNDGSGNLSWSTVSGATQWTTAGSDIYYSSGNVGIGTSTMPSTTTSNGHLALTGVGIYPYSTYSGTGTMTPNTSAYSGAVYAGNFSGDNGANNLTLSSLTSAPVISNSGAGGSNLVGVRGVLSAPSISSTAAGARVFISGVQGVARRGATADLSSQSSNQLVGGQFNAVHLSTLPTTALTTDAIGMAGATGNHSGTMTNQVAVQAGTDIASFTTSAASTTNVAYQFYGNRFNVGSTSGGPGTLTDGYGMYLVGPTVGTTGTITNYYGVYLGPSAVTGTLTNNYGIYQADTAAKNYFAGNVGVGKVASSSALDVKGTVAISGATSGAVTFAVPAAAGSATYTWPSAAPASNMLLQSDSSGVLSWVAAGGAGTVTSVSSANSDISVATGTTTPALTLNSGTTGGAGDANKIAKLDASGLLTAAMIPNLAASKITSGQLGVANGGTGLASGTSGGIPYFSGSTTMASSAALTANGVVIGGGAGAAPTATSAPTGSGQVLRWNGSAWAPNFISMFDLRSTVTGSATFGSGSAGCTSNQTLTWTSATDNLACTNISLPVGQITGTLAATNGGTGQSSFAVGDLLYASTTTALTRLPASTSGYVLTSNGAGTAPSWQAASSGVGGSGTANFIPKFSAGTTLANSLLSESGSTLAMDGSLSRVFSLTTQGTNAGNNLTIKAGDAGSTTTAQNGGVLYLAGGSVTGSATNSSVEIQTASGAAASGVVTNATTKMTITGAGNVGIGTATPAQLLEVAGNVNVGSQTTRSTASTNRGQLASGSTYTQTSAGSASVNWNNGNQQEVSTFVCNGSNTLTFTNMRDGGAYSLLLSGTAAHSGTCVFSAAGLTFKTSGGAVAPTASKDVLITFAVIGTTVVYSMIDNLQ